MMILILSLVFWNSKPYPFFGQIWVEKPGFSWLIVLTACCSYIFLVAQSKKLNQSKKERLIDGIIVPIKTFIIKKVMLQPKLWNKIKTTYKLLHNGHPFNMYAIISIYTEILF